MRRLLLISVLLVPSALFALDQELTSLFSDLVKNDTAKGAKIIAIMPFKAAGQGVTEDVGRSVAEFGVVALQASGQYTVVERDQMIKAVEEIQLSQTGLMNDSSGLTVGKMLSADRLLLGTVSDIFGKRIISARIIKTETGKVVSSASITVTAKDLSTFSRDLLSEKGQISATLFRSALIPGWGQLYTNHPVQGGASLVLFLGSIGYLVYCFNATSKAKDESNAYNSYLGSPAWEQEAVDTLKALYGSQTNINQATLNQALVDYYSEKQNNLYQTYSDKFDQAVLAGIIAGGIWTLNLIDAAILGSKEKKKFNLYFSGTPSQPVKLQISYKL